MSFHRFEPMLLWKSSFYENECQNSNPLCILWEMAKCITLTFLVCCSLSHWKVFTVLNTEQSSGEQSWHTKHLQRGQWMKGIDRNSLALTNSLLDTQQEKRKNSSKHRKPNNLQISLKEFIHTEVIIQGSSIDYSKAHGFEQSPEARGCS